MGRVPQSITSIDPTLLADGSYNLVVTATDGISTPTTVSRNITIQSNLKIGNFSVAFTDMTISVDGLSIAVVRSYDTLNAGGLSQFSSDENGTVPFARMAPGWKLELPTTSLSITNPYGDELVYDSRVTVTLPDGSKQSFLFEPVATGAYGSSYSPAFVPADAKTTATLAGSDALLLSDGSGQWFVDASTGNAYNPSNFTLTTRDGVQYTIDAKTGDLLLLTDRNGNSLHFTGDGITSDSGTGVQFLYDSAGRISQIIDPAGNRVAYGYDSNGDLVSFTDRTGQTVHYVYDQTLTHRPHFLTQIIDARGVTVMQTQFDETTGQLTALKDALNNMAGFTYRADLPSVNGGLSQFSSDENGTVPLRFHLESVTDANGVPTESVRDDEGNVLRTIRRVQDNADPALRVYQATVDRGHANGLDFGRVVGRSGDLIGEAAG